MEKIMSIQQAADYLGVCYQTIFEKRHALGYQLPGGRKWFIPASALVNLSQKRNNVFRLSLQVERNGKNLCRSTRTKDPQSGGFLYQDQTDRELDDLLAQPTKRQHKSTTTR